MVVFVHLPFEERKVFAYPALLPLERVGTLGVDLFFVISGFIMVATTWNQFGRPGAPRDFLIRRVLRIYPLWMIGVAATVATALLLPGVRRVDGGLTPAHALLSFFLIPHGRDPVILFGWSLSYELIFYRVFALALATVRRRLWLVLAAWSAFVLVCCAAATAGAGGPVVAYLGNPLSLEFVAGAAAGYAYRSGALRYAGPALALGVEWFAGAALASTHVGAIRDADPLLLARVLAAGPAAVFVVFGAAAVEARDGLVAPRPLVVLGDASYSMYLFNGYLMALVALVARRAHLSGPLAHAAFVVTGLAVVAFGALAIFRFVEAPLIAALRGYGRTPGAARAAA